jgi:hypothetical protein
VAMQVPVPTGVSAGASAGVSAGVGEYQCRWQCRCQCRLSIQISIVSMKDTATEAWRGSIKPGQGPRPRLRETPLWLCGYLCCV